MGRARELTRDRGWRRGARALLLAGAASLALGLGGCCLDDGSGCDADDDCCSNYCDPDYGDCVSAATRMSRATQSADRTLAQRSAPREPKLRRSCLRGALAR